MTKRILHLDFETASSLDLTKVGLENYVRAPGFEVTTMAWTFDDDPVTSVTHRAAMLPPPVREHIAAGGVIRAWNASFEWWVLTYYFNIGVDWGTQMDCVMQRALAWGLPASLQMAGEALRLNIVKDKTARALMLKMGKPRRDGTFWHHDQSLEAIAMLNDLAAYCRRDVEAERALDRAIPALSKTERELSLVDHEINRRGVLIDIPTVTALRAAAQGEMAGFNAECDKLTQGAVKSPGTEGAKMLAWLHGQGWTTIPDLRKETVAGLLARSSGQVPTGVVRRVLELRQLSAKSSVAKLERMMDVASTHDGRARNLFQFYGAGRTGRWAGRLIQVQNLPRPQEGLDVERAIAVAKTDPAGLGLFHVSPMKAISGCLRGCLVARHSLGHTLVSIDLSQIEARIIAWLAGQDDVLEAFRRGEDVYTLQAKKVGSGDRQLGKVLTLACGYGMGPDKFRDTAETQYGLTMTLPQALGAVAAWRKANSNITKFWRDARDAAVEAITTGAMLSVGAIRIKLVGGVLYVRKPNGDKLAYHNARMVDGDIVFDGLDQKTNQWGPQRTYGGKLVENWVQAVARDVMALGLALSAADGLVPIMHLHDEIVWETADNGGVDLKANMLRGMMLAGAGWTRGLPLEAKIKISRRFGK